MSPDQAAIEFGPDPENPGRFYAEMRWDNTEAHVHESLRAINEDTPIEAVESLVEEWQHMIDYPEKHEFPA